MNDLCLAHIDCDAFFASVEKRQRPELADVPVIIGGGQRGVVATCCYLARMSGVRSAMPMFKARKLCPQAVIIKPDMALYAQVGQEVRQKMLELSPLVEPVSIDEAFIDLSGTQKLLHGPPALALARFAQAVERDLRITVSIGLSSNKSMAKMASDMGKPRGFTILGRLHAEAFLAPMPVRALFGVGEAMARKLNAAGYQNLGDLQKAPVEALWRSFGEHGPHLRDLALGIDPRPVRTERERKSVSSERTFQSDCTALDGLRAAARGACERVSAQLKAKGLCGRAVTLKLKTSDFRTITRSHSLARPTQSADRLFRTAESMLLPLIGKQAYRLLGVGISELEPSGQADDRDLADARAQRRGKAEAAMDSVRARFGSDALKLGLMLGSEGVQAEGSAVQSAHSVGRKAAKPASSPRSENEP